MRGKWESPGSVSKKLEDIRKKSVDLGKTLNGVGFLRRSEFQRTEEDVTRCRLLVCSFLRVGGTELNPVKKKKKTLH